MSRQRTQTEWMELLARAVDGDLTAHERVDMEAELSHNHQLASLYHRMAAVKAACACVEEEEELCCPGLEDRVLQNIKKTRSGQVWMQWGMAAAASVLMVVGVSRLVGMGNENPTVQMAEASSISTDQNLALQQDDVSDFIKPTMASPAAQQQESETVADSPTSEESTGPLVLTGSVSFKVAAAKPPKNSPVDSDRGSRELTVRPVPTEVEADAPPPQDLVEQETVATSQNRPAPEMVANFSVPAPKADTNYSRGGDASPRNSGMVASADNRYRGVSVRSRQEVPADSRGPIRIVRYFQGPEGLVNYAWITVDPNFSPAQIQAVFTNHTSGLTALSRENFSAVGAETLPEDALVMQIQSQDFSHLLNALPGATPDQLFIRPDAKRPLPVMLTEILSQMGPDLVVAVVPAR